MTLSEKHAAELTTIEYLASDIADCVMRQRAIASDNRGYYGRYGFEYNGTEVTLANSATAIKRKIVMLRSMLLELSKEIK